MTKTTADILKKVREFLFTQEFRDACRTSKRHFTRSRIFSFPILVVMIVNLLKKSLQVDVTNFTELIALPNTTRQAFSAARMKFRPQAFEALNQVLIDEYYTDNDYKTFHGFRLIAIDGLTLELPDTKQTRKKFGVCTRVLI